MKIFISHQKADSELAHGIAKRLDAIHDIASYLDVIDPVASQTGDALGEYLRAQMGQCTQLIVVVSDSTKGSWWVPWEIGIATEKDYPIATYAEEKRHCPNISRSGHISQAFPIWIRMREFRKPRQRRIGCTRAS